jgi:hypothetical protein
MTTNDQPNDHLLDRELMRLRQEWVTAYHALMQVAGSAAVDTGTNLTDEQRTALNCYRAAETAYFGHPRMRNPKTA